MRAKLKLLIGITIAMTALMVTSKMASEDMLWHTPSTKEICYSEIEIGLLMRAHHWSRSQAVEILDLACRFSHSH